VAERFSLDQLLSILKILFTPFTKQAIFVGSTTVLPSPALLMIALVSMSKLCAVLSVIVVKLVMALTTNVA